MRLKSDGHPDPSTRRSGGTIENPGGSGVTAVTVYGGVPPDGVMV